MTEKEIFSHKAPNYLLCFINECPRRASCLRWLVGQELQSNEYNILSVNPMHPEVKANKCALYREKKHVRYAKGMMHFYDEMTRSQEVGIKHRLIVHYGIRRNLTMMGGKMTMHGDSGNAEHYFNSQFTLALSYK